MAFSKKATIAYLEKRIEHMKKEHGFTTGNGYAQVTDKGEEKNRAYGEWISLRNILNSIEDGLIG